MFVEAYKLRLSMVAVVRCHFSGLEGCVEAGALVVVNARWSYCTNRSSEYQPLYFRYCMHDIVNCI